MKKTLLFLLITLLLSACSSVKIPYNISAGKIDYSPLVKKGIFITESNSVSFDYAPIGSVFVSIESGFERIDSKSKVVANEIYGNTQEYKSYKYGNWKRATVEDALNELYNHVVDFKANGIINLKIESTSAVYDKSGRMLKPNSIYITGMAIKK